MNFDWTREEAELASKVSAVFGAECVSQLEALEHADLDEMRRTTLSFLKKLPGTGYLGLALGPKAKGEIMTLIAGQERLAVRSNSLFLAVESSARLFGGLLRGFGNPQALGQILDPLARGETIAAVAVSEPEERDSPAAALTYGVARGDGFLVTGKKSYMTNGPIADWIAVTGEIQGSPAVFLVRGDQRGVHVGPRLSTVGYNGIAVSALDLDKAEVPGSHVMGPFEDRRHLDFLATMQDLVLTMASVGLIERTVAFSKNYAQSHVRGGKQIVKYQEVRFKLADMLTLSHSSKLLAYRAGWLLSVGDPEAATVLRCAKVFSSEAAEQTAIMAMQIMAGAGYVSGNPVERAYRDAKLAALGGTTSEVARMAIAADQLRRYQVQAHGSH